ncbi:hypothetical protein BH20ACI2_BH20ACI2_20160 [soil metagenome]
MNFETFFRLISYAAVFCGFLSLWVAGSFGLVVPGTFLGLMFAAWFLEDSKWQISEKAGTALIVLALPAFILAWRFRLLSLFYEAETEIAAALALLILSLSAIKLLQKKGTRDWVFLYLMSFFEVMLAAGLSISGLYLLSFLIYLLVMVCAVISLEIRKAAIAVDRVSPTSEALRTKVMLPAGKLPATAVILIVFISLLALPLFFMLPRVGGAGFGGSKSGLQARSGFSDIVRLGGIGLIQENDEVVMRVKLDTPADPGGLYFRGIALDTFDNQSWSRSTGRSIEQFEKGERDLIQIDKASSREDLTIQTIYLEPLDTPVLFALPRAVLIQGSFPFLYKDLYGAISFQTTLERVSYKVLSDRSIPSPARLRADVKPYSADLGNSRQLPPVFDPRIAELAERISKSSTNRYDKAKSIEAYLQSNYSYTLEQSAGGREPLSDFLFNVREGHCEYFATAMAIMLRTQGIATRVVNGFHGGEFNDAAGVTIVRQRNAHAWVEVYFPEEDAWVLFDPTPAAGINAAGFGGGFAGTVRKYAEALETFWIQYFVAFDDQEQRSLARSVRSGMADFQVYGANYLAIVKDIFEGWWAEVRGADGGQARMFAIAKGVGVLVGTIFLFFFVRWLFRWVIRWRIWQKRRMVNRPGRGIVDFYARMQDLLAERGIRRAPFQTPLEFAAGLKIPEVVKITDRYNRVRFGQQDLNRDEANEIDAWLQRIHGSDPAPKRSS